MANELKLLTIAQQARLLAEHQQMFGALNRICAYRDTDKLLRQCKLVGCTPLEGLEDAYEDVRAHARMGISRIRSRTPSKETGADLSGAERKSNG